MRKLRLIKIHIERKILFSSRRSKSWHDTWTNLKQLSRYLNSCVFRYPQIHQHLQEFLVRTFPLWYSSTTRCRLLGRLCRATNRLGKVLLRVIHLENRTLKESGTERFFGAPYMKVITIAAITRVGRNGHSLHGNDQKCEISVATFFIPLLFFFPPSSRQHPHQASVKDFNHFFSLNFRLVFCFVLFSGGHSHNGSSA